MTDNQYIDSAASDTGDTTTSFSGMTNKALNYADELRESLEFSIENINIDTSSPNIYVLVEAYTNTERIGYTTLPITDSVFTFSNTNSAA